MPKHITQNNKVQQKSESRGLSDEQRLTSYLIYEPWFVETANEVMSGDDIKSKICKACFHAVREIVANHPEAAKEPDSETYKKLLKDAVVKRGIPELEYDQFWDGLYGEIIPQPQCAVDVKTVAKLIHSAGVKRRNDPIVMGIYDKIGSLALKCSDGNCTGEDLREALLESAERLVVDGGEVKGADEFEFLHPSEIDEPIEVEWWWRNFIPKQVIVILSALPKVGKTTLLRAVVARMEKGGACCGQRVESCKVLYVSEEGKRTWKPRLHQFGIGDHVLLSCVPFLGRPTMPDFRRYLRAVERIIKGQGIGIVIFDTASKLLPIGKENDSDDVDPAMAELARLTEAGASVIVVHHDRKSGGDPVSRMRGSLAYGASADVILSLEKMKNAGHDDPRRVLYGDGRFDEVESELVIEFDGSNFVADGSKAEVRRLDEMQIIREILSGSPDTGIRVEDIWKAWPADQLIARPRKTKFYDIMKRGAESDPPEWKRTGTGRSGSPFCFSISTLRDGPRTEENNNHIFLPHTHSIGGRKKIRGISDDSGLVSSAEQNGRITQTEEYETATNGYHRSGFTDRYSNGEAPF